MTPTVSAAAGPNKYNSVSDEYLCVFLYYCYGYACDWRRPPEASDMIVCQNIDADRLARSFPQAHRPINTSNYNALSRRRVGSAS